MNIIGRSVHKVYVIARIAYYHLFSKRIQIEKDVTFRSNLRLNCSKNGKITIGHRCFFNNDCSINSHMDITIGDDCIFGEGVKIYDHNHKFRSKSKPIHEQGYSCEPIEIGSNCWFGSNVVIIPGAKIGDNVVVGAGCLIHESIPSDMIVRNNAGISLEKWGGVKMESNNSNPLVSIIMPVYNSKKYLRRAVQSVLKQTMPDFELLLIDDGSTDGSGVLCDELAIQDSRIRVYHKENGGVCSARNYGIRISSGKYITFIDNDDIYDEQFCEVLIDMLEKSNADIAKCGRRNIKITPEQEILTERICTWGKTEVMDKDEFRSQYYELKTSEILSAVWNGVYCRDTLISSGVRFDETLRHGNEDILFNSEFFGYCRKVAMTDRVLYTHYYRIGHSTSMKFYPDQITSRIKVLNEEIKLVNADEIDMVILEGIRECFRLMLPLKRKHERDEYIRMVKSELDFTVFNRVPLINNPELSPRAKLDLIMIRSELYWLYFTVRRTRIKLQ